MKMPLCMLILHYSYKRASFQYNRSLTKKKRKDWTWRNTKDVSTFSFVWLQVRHIFQCTERAAPRPFSVCCSPASCLLPAFVSHGFDPQPPLPLTLNLSTTISGRRTPLAMTTWPAKIWSKGKQQTRGEEIILVCQNVSTSSRKFYN